MAADTVKPVGVGGGVRSGSSTWDSGAIGSTGDGPAHSAEAVRHRIKTLIDRETHESLSGLKRIVPTASSAAIRAER